MADLLKTNCKNCKKEYSAGRTMIYILKKGQTTGCCRSCVSRKNRLLGKPYEKSLYNSPIYQSWYNMKTRCLNFNSPNYQGYGLRGITICNKWLTFGGFLEDMQSSYKKELTLERINNNGNYCKENCRWATRKEQANNTRNIERAEYYLFNGVKKTIRQWAVEFKIKRTTLGMRLQKYNWPIKKALTIN